MGGRSLVAVMVERREIELRAGRLPCCWFLGGGGGRGGESHQANTPPTRGSQKKELLSNREVQYSVCLPASSHLLLIWAGLTLQFSSYGSRGQRRMPDTKKCQCDLLHVRSDPQQIDHWTTFFYSSRKVSVALSCRSSN
jgi:hypothetical protein